MAYLQDDPPLPALSSLFPHFYDEVLSESVDPFTISSSSGFLPLRPPLTTLPVEFEALAKILNDMPIVKEDGEAGLLASFKLGPLIDGGALPNLTSEVDRNVDQLSIITALFRDYSFLASAYLLEPCWESWSKDHEAGYGLGRAVLPSCIAGPLVKTAKM